jgi:hypothetical protein
MRIISEKPIEIVRALVRDHLVRLWIEPEELLGIVDPNAVAAPITACFAEHTCATKVNPATLGTRTVLSSERAGERTFAIIGALGPDSAADIVLVLTDKMEPIFAVQTHAAIHSDGVIQIAGAESGITLLTAEQAKAQRNRVMVRGLSLRAFSLEERDATGSWRTKPITMALDPDVVSSVSFD